jgi:SAM-dependent methyltransferase
MTHEYGKGQWDKLWEKLEQEGNVGLDYVINPYLYPEIVQTLSSTPKAIVVDFGCGTNLMGIQLLYGYADSIVALKQAVQLDHARFNTMLYLGLEGQKELVQRSRSYLKDLGDPTHIATEQAHIGGMSESYFDAGSIDLCVSRNFLMHLSAEEYKKHLEQVRRMLKNGGQYIFATLNPAYELAKAGRPLEEGERYDFAHGKSGEYGTFYHFYKTVDQYEAGMDGFEIEKKIACLPISDQFRSSHERYYNPEAPMAFVYVLKKKKVQ